ncbi:MAG: helix-turn-helix transcriptional regulator [Marivibrio sp.]|uniref:helix-turn-helix transcriptional regulator n=1 Tax=Marivibrio sp. TaxID=2039719 RepID=UPI0032EBE010
MITAAQIRAGRALINAKQSELAKAAGVSLATLNNIERGVGDPRVSTLEAIERALAGAGVEVEQDGQTQTVRLLSLSRPSAYETYFASQRILELIGPGSLLKVERLLFFARWDHGAGEAGDKHRLCLLVEGANRAVLFDQVKFTLNGGARAAEVAGVMLAAYALHAERLYYLADVMEDTTLAPLDEAAQRLRAMAWRKMIHPKPFIDVFDDWDARAASFGVRDGHPFAALVQRLDRGPDGSDDVAWIDAPAQIQEDGSPNGREARQVGPQRGE